MKEKFVIPLQSREETGSSRARQVRREGDVPAVIYGHGGAGRPVRIPGEQLNDVLHHAGMLTLKIKGVRKQVSAILKDVQQHPITGHVLHIDFQEVRADEVIQITITLEPHGEPAGLQSGGQLEQLLHEMEVSCLPSEMVESVTVDVSGLELDDVMYVKDVKLPEGITGITDPENPVFQVRIPRMEPVEEPEEGVEAEGELEEPEVIGEKTDEEETEEKEE